MFIKPIVVIIGAGASAEFKLPLGTSLKSTIANDLGFKFEQFGRNTSGDTDLFHILRGRFSGDTLQAYTRAGQQLAGAMNAFISIDEALHYFATSTEAVSIGKVAIVRRILSAERDSMLKNQSQYGRPNLSAAEGTWIPHLLSMALAGIQREKIEDVFANVTFINFNYDRAVEHYFYWALKTYVGASEQQAANAIAKINMIRPYGCVARLPWQESEGTPVQFGDTDLAEHDPFKLAGNIKTYTEQTSTDIRFEIGKTIAPAALVLILGFGFHQQNMKLLQTAPFSCERKFVMYTAVGVDRENYEMITGELLKSMCSHTPTGSGIVRAVPKSAAQLMNELRPMIMGAVS
jgi:hypothetical protein